MCPGSVVNRSPTFPDSLAWSYLLSHFPLRGTNLHNFSRGAEGAEVSVFSFFKLEGASDANKWGLCTFHLPWGVVAH